MVTQLNTHDTVTCSGLLSGARDRIHFELYCEDCDAWRLAWCTLGQVETMYRQGRVTQDAFEAYRHVWATGAYWYGSYDGWDVEPTIPAVIRYVRKIRSAHSIRKAEASA
jgi:hypothetical protein